MTGLLDTSVVIDLLRGNQAALDTVRVAVGAGHDLAASVVVKVEVLAGMRPHEEQRTRRLLDGIDGIAVDDLIAEGAGMLANEYARSHTGIKHFPMFANLKPPY